MASIFSTPTAAKRPLALNLFSGTGSVTEALTGMGYDVHTLDVRRVNHPTFFIGSLKWDYRAIPPHTYEVIFASPPCEEFSVAKTVVERNLGYALKLVQHTLQIIDFLQPEKWVLENPQTGILARHPIMRRYIYRDFDYCQFSDWGYRKRTRIWGSSHLELVPEVLCDRKNCENMMEGLDGRLRHRQWLGGRGYQPTTAMKHRVPVALEEFVHCGKQ